jgi:hypothetical protein
MTLNALMPNGNAPSGRPEVTGARSSCRTGDPDTVVLETIGLDWSGQAGPRLFGLAFDLLQRTGVGLVHGAFPLKRSRRMGRCHIWACQRGDRSFQKIAADFSQDEEVRKVRDNRHASNIQKRTRECSSDTRLSPMPPWSWNVDLPSLSAQGLLAPSPQYIISALRPGSQQRGLLSHYPGVLLTPRGPCPSSSNPG